MTEDISQARTRNYVQQVRGAALFKGMAVAAAFFSIPLMIHYLGQEQYGVWSMLLSIMSWVVFFDLGIGSGLRNKLAEALAKDNIGDAVACISAGYTWLGIIALFLLFIIAVASYFVPWAAVFNTRVVGEQVLRRAVLISGLFVLLNFWIGLINHLFNAVQRSSWVVLGQFVTNLLILLFVFILTKTADASLLYMAVVYGLSMLAASLVLSVGFFKARPELIPYLSLDKEKAKPLLTLGWQFFTIQLAMLIIFSTDRLMIGQLFGAQSVAQYDVVARLFGILLLVHGLITAPLWSASTDAYHRKDLAWIKVTLRNQLVVFACLALCAIVVGMLANPIVTLWIGKDLSVPPFLVLTTGVFTVVSIWNNVFGFILGGINKVRLGSFYTVIMASLNIPVSYYFAVALHMGVAGIMLGTTVAILISSVISPIQVYYFVYTGQHSKFLSRVLR